MIAPLYEHVILATYSLVFKGPNIGGEGQIFQAICQCPLVAGESSDFTEISQVQDWLETYDKT